MASGEQAGGWPLIVPATRLSDLHGLRIGDEERRRQYGEASIQQRRESGRYA